MAGIMLLTFILLFQMARAESVDLLYAQQRHEVKARRIRHRIEAFDANGKLRMSLMNETVFNRPSEEGVSYYMRYFHFDGGVDARMVSPEEFRQYEAAFNHLKSPSMWSFWSQPGCVVTADTETDFLTANCLE